jgi:hypothetical protein
MNRHLNNEGQEYETGHVKGRVNEEGKGGTFIQLRNFTHA